MPHANQLPASRFCLLQASNLQSQLSASQAAQASLTSQVTELTSERAALTSANASLQQALMDNTMQAARDAEALRQQHSKQLAAMREQHRQQVQDLKAAAEAQQEAHKQVGVGE